MGFWARISAWFSGSGISDQVRKAAANVLTVVGAVGLAILEAKAEQLVAEFENKGGPGQIKKDDIRFLLAGIARKEGIPVTKRVLNKIIEDAVNAIAPDDDLDKPL